MQVAKPQNLLDILENEIDYLEHCVDNPFGELSPHARKHHHEARAFIDRRLINSEENSRALTVAIYIENWSHHESE